MYHRIHDWLIFGAFLATVLFGSAAGHAATPGELLEKAIYTEETVGDLDKAVELYQEVIAAGDTARTSAAQAQYRLGRIYQKQGKQQEAEQAFQKLIDQYPGEQEWVTKAREQRPGQIVLQPVPWGDGDTLQFHFKLPTGLDVGTHLYTVEIVEHEGEKTWRCSTRGLVTLNNAQTYSTVLCGRDDFAPISSHWLHSLLGEAKAVYNPDAVKITNLIDNKQRTIELDGRVFDNEQGAELFRRLPLAVGYEATVPIVSTLGSARVDLGLEVPAKETIETPAGKFDCFKLALNLGQDFWISDDENRYVVRFQAGGVTADLVKIYPSATESSRNVDGEHFSLTLPADWFSYSPQAPDGDQKTSVYLLDPHAEGHVKMTLGPTADLPENQRRSPVAWTQAVIERFDQSLQDFQLRKEKLEETRIGGEPAVRFVADFTERGKQKVLYGTGILGDGRAATFQVITAAEDFAEFRQSADQIVETLRLK